MKEDKLFLNVLRTVEQFIQGKQYRPLTKSEIQERLKLPKEHGPLLMTILKKLCSDKVLKLAKGRYATHESFDATHSGIIRIHPRGFGFVVVEGQKDIFIPKPYTMGAVDGDTVQVEIDTRFVSEKGPEGKVVAIVERGRSQIAGIVNSRLKNGDYTLFVPLLGKEKIVLITKSPFKISIGDRLILKILEWGDEEMTVTPLEKMGHISDPSIDNFAAIKEFDIRSDFTPEMIKEAKSWGKAVKKEEYGRRRDLTKDEIFTIDPDTAKDFDDALSLTLDEKGHYHLGVHIADVSHYVEADSLLDKEAFMRCNSTYFPGYCIPMIPSDLSDNLCSLKEKVARLTVTVQVEFDATGNILHYDIYKSIIKSQKRFTYKEALTVINGTKKSKHRPTLLRMVELTRLLKKKRFERGSIEFSLPEVTLKIDKDGVPTHTETVYYDITHQLVEEFMLKANELVALHLFNKGKNVTYRIHDTPSEDNLRDFALLAGAFGFKVPLKPTPQDIQRLFEEAEGSPLGPYLATHYIRKMKLAQYSPQNIGHFGLSLSHYCHFTSPIRRYVDLVAHRLLFGMHDDLKHLELITNQASEKERLSAKAEMSVLTLKKLRFASNQKEKEANKVYDAVITKIKPFGFFFEVVDLMLEGFIHVSELKDYYHYDDRAQTLTGERRGGQITVGNKISVYLKEVDLIHHEAFWDLCDSR